jgi:2-C-methyl-D-erythritol 4-phosphate cytidylyltransferase
MTKEVYAVFVAGGSGSRMGGEVPKQFLQLGDVPVLQRTVENFLEAWPQSKVIIVLPERHIQMWRELCLEHAASFPQTIVKGGMTRFHSVRNALEKVPSGAIVAIHDGVRPFASKKLISGMIETMLQPSGPDCLIPAVPVTDTLRSTNPETPSPDRSCLVSVQTPQLFKSEVIKEAYKQAYSTSFTDDASVAERAGYSVEITEGERYNIKITTPEDMHLARLLLK